MQTTIGKNTLGDSDKMKVDLRTYNRSTHNLSHAWRSTMGVGTLVPCLKKLALPGDTFDIEIAQKVMTHPTVGPLFGSYKLQVDIFTCPIRLYNAMLHNNALNVGMDMSQVKLPKIRFKSENYKKATDLNTSPTNRNVSASSIISYLGINNLKMTSVDGAGEKEYNGTPLLAYLDIFKNYYLNKQEGGFYYLGKSIEGHYGRLESATWDGSSNILTAGYITSTAKYELTAKYKIQIHSGTKVLLDDDTIKDYFDIQSQPTGGTKFTLKSGKKFDWGSRVVDVTVFSGIAINLVACKDDELDNIREGILKAGKTQVYLDTLGSKYINDVCGGGTAIEERFNVYTPNMGLLIKTHSSDIFNNWVNTEWVDGENGIANITAVDTSEGKFSIDTLNLAQKVYNMLNRIAVSGGTYRDWITTVYTADGYGHVETPIYEGGMSAEIQFEEVVSTAMSQDQPLGTLGGRGTSGENNGGKLHIKIEEPSYIIGIASITPRVDYSQGTEWDMELNTLDDLHKPALDGIGYQDLLVHQVAGWVHPKTAWGKTVAWINYMTDYNRAHGNFAAGESEDFMVLNKVYRQRGGEYTVQGTDLQVTSYINPTDYINQFAEQSLEAQDFWVQLGFKIEARRVMSAKQIPLI